MGKQDYERLQNTEVLKRIVEAAGLLAMPNLQPLRQLHAGCLHAVDMDRLEIQVRKQRLRDDGFAAMARLLASTPGTRAIDHRPYLSQIQDLRSEGRNDE